MRRFCGRSAPRAAISRLRPVIGGLGERGMSFVSVLLALLIAAALYFGYFQFQNSGAERATGVNAIATSRAVACRTQRQQIERDIVMWSVNHPDEPASLAALERDGIQVPACPEGGRYDVAGRSVQCSVHR